MGDIMVGRQYIYITTYVHKQTHMHSCIDSPLDPWFIRFIMVSALPEAEARAGYSPPP